MEYRVARELYRAFRNSEGTWTWTMDTHLEIFNANYRSCSMYL